MSRGRKLLIRLASLGIAAAWVIGPPSRVAVAQYIGVTTPFQSFTESYYNRTGVNFGFQIPGASGGRGVVGLMPNGQLSPDGAIRFGQFSHGAALPPFGGYDPGADAHLGFRVGGGGGPSFNFNLTMGQGSSRTASVVAPTVVVPNGGSGYFFNGTQRPFVTGIVPVVGAMPSSYYIQPAVPTYVNPVAYKLSLLDQQVARGQRPDVWRHDDDDDDGGLSLSGSGASGSSSASVSARPDRSTASQPARSLAEIRRSRGSARDREEDERREKFLDHVAAAQFAIERRVERSALSNLDRAEQYAATAEERALVEELRESLRRE